MIKGRHNRSKRTRMIAAIGIVLVVGLLAAAASQPYVRNKLLNNTLIYSESAALSETWHKFTLHNIETGSGRSLDDHTSNVTSSRSQSLTLLRAVWVDDKATYDLGWKWDQSYALKQNGLLITSYGPRANGSYGVINEASDSTADVNTALSLLMAYRRWDEPQYLTDAENLISASYSHDVTTADGSAVIAASDASTSSAALTVSSSAFNTAAFKEFAKVDPAHDWTGLVNNTYTLQTKLIAANDGLLPNTASLSADNGTVTIIDPSFGQDAATDVWNLGLDYSWNNDVRDKAILSDMPKINAQYQQNGTLLVGASESAAYYGKLTSYFDITQPHAAPTFYAQKVSRLYNQDKQEWRQPLSFQDDTWVWLGMALHDGSLQQLTEQSNTETL